MIPLLPPFNSFFSSSTLIQVNWDSDQEFLWQPNDQPLQSSVSVWLAPACTREESGRLPSRTGQTWSSDCSQQAQGSQPWWKMVWLPPAWRLASFLALDTATPCPAAPSPRTAQGCLLLPGSPGPAHRDGSAGQLALLQRLFQAPGHGVTEGRIRTCFVLPWGGFQPRGHALSLLLAPTPSGSIAFSEWCE